MFTSHALSRLTWPGLAMIGALTLSAQPVFAGECPAGKIKPNAQQMVDHKPVGVTDVTLGAIDLGKQPAHIEGRELRFRKLTIAPGGIVPWHSHDDRPALIFVQQGPRGSVKIPRVWSLETPPPDDRRQRR
ncbi:hypothetical protein ACVIU7_006210 [Bradyrhizobium liaoningense]|uniref:hypothetical protein n=1 Tax=Bradyrhizobium TaxID=374 RepID=UPI000400BB51|nr:MULTISPECIES: hypothetical protein [Bradyrhizobium]WLB87334.1 hypothetical protein QIH91_31870 [Bradyrhizobium japonicum USDA 135]GLR95829.1 hypothetical protein GCM10007858_34660 [Bradyrhizobium liaoningense]